MAQTTLELSDHHDIKALAKAYAENGMVRITKLFPDDVAEQIYTVLERQTPWRFVHSDAQGKHKYYTPEEWQNTPPQEKRDIIDNTLSRAQTGFAYIYSCYPMISTFLNGEDPNWPLHGMTEFLNSPDFQHFVKTITNEPSVIKLDCQATLYSRGHFLNVHDDTGDNAERRAAYVMSFTKNWSANYGGQLLFLDENNEAERGFIPSFNTLTLFKVPRTHIVTQVSNFAPHGRYSITGWLRDDPK